MNVTDTTKKLVHFLRHDLWEIDLGSLNKYKLFLIKTLRLINVAIRELTEGQLTLRAMSLVYTTLLSIVPVLAISFSVLKAFGVHNEVVEPFLTKFLAPLGSKGEEITSQIIGFVENMNVGVLGSIGLGMLIYTVISVIQKIEASFNFIWRIKKARSLARRFSDYVSVIIVGPILIFSAMGLTASFMSNTIVQAIVSIEPFGTVFYYFVEKLPYIIVCAAFTFLYIFIPNTRVKFKSALIGGLLAGILWETAGWAFASFVITSTKYAAVYSGFAILLMFMIWLYVSWLILLVGAQISFYHQYPYFIDAQNKLLNVSHRLREKLTFLIMYYIGHNFHNNKKPWTLDALVAHLQLPVDSVHDTITNLEKNAFLLETGDEPPAYIPARELEAISLRDLMYTARMTDAETLAIENHLTTVPEVDGVLHTVDSAVTDTFGSKTLKDLVDPVK
jgi:membrane protein